MRRALARLWRRYRGLCRLAAPHDTVSLETLRRLWRIPEPDDWRNHP